MLIASTVLPLTEWLKAYDPFHYAGDTYDRWTAATWAESFQLIDEI